jgi:hypothetical protein
VMNWDDTGDEIGDESYNGDKVTMKLPIKPILVTKLMKSEMKQI